MMVGKEDLGLSLSLSTTTTTRTDNNHNRYPPLQLNLMPSSISSHQNHHHHHNHHQSASPSSFFSHQKNPWNEAFGSSDRSFLRGIDVNRMPSTTVTVDCEEEEAGISSPNSTVSSISGKRSERDLTNYEDNEIERTSSRGGGISDEEDGDNSRKKLRLSKDQSAILEESFKEHNTLNPKQKLALAKQLNLRPRQVEVWFQNRRARTKLKQTEVDCEFLKRCCENLTDENRRLQKEVQELRALKLSPQFYMQMTPPTTLTMCPSCERVAVSSSNNGNPSSAVGASAVPPSTAGKTTLHHHHNHHVGIGHQHNHPRALPINAWPPTPIQHRS